MLLNNFSVGLSEGFSLSDAAAAVPDSVNLSLLDVVEHLLRFVGGVVVQDVLQQLHQVFFLLYRQGLISAVLCTYIRLILVLFKGTVS